MLFTHQLIRSFIIIVIAHSMLNAGNTQLKPKHNDLILAIENNNLKTVQELLKNPTINPNLQDDYINALTLASYKGHTEIIGELIKHPKINPNIVDHNGSTALILASQRGDYPSIKKLLKHNHINLNLKNAEHNTALYYAIEWSPNLAIVKIFLENGANPFIPSYKKIMDALGFIRNFATMNLIKELVQNYMNFYLSKTNSVGDPVTLFYALDAQNFAHIKLLRSYIIHALLNKNRINPALKNLYSMYATNKDSYAKNLQLIFPDNIKKNKVKQEIMRLVSLTSLEYYDLMFKYL